MVGSGINHPGSATLLWPQFAGILITILFLFPVYPIHNINLSSIQSYTKQSVEYVVQSILCTILTQFVENRFDYSPLRLMCSVQCAWHTFRQRLFKDMLHVVAKKMASMCRDYRRPFGGKNTSCFGRT
jgi:hypothetical protein